MEEVKHSWCWHCMGQPVPQNGVQRLALCSSCIQVRVREIMIQAGRPAVDVIQPDQQWR